MSTAMFRGIIAFLLLTFGVFLVYVFFDAAWHPLNWWITNKRGTVTAYESYLARFPQQGHDAEAQEQIETLYWQQAATIEKVELAQEYLKRYPTGRFVREARQRIEDLSWAEATTANTVASLNTYLAAYPKGRHRKEAVRKMELAYREQASTSKTIESYNEYLRRFPTGQFARTALGEIELVFWREAEGANTPASYQAYLKAYPQGRFANKAIAAQSKSLNDPEPFNAAIHSGDVNSLKDFVASYPGHRLETEAKETLKDLEGRDIAELLREKRIEVVAEGSGIEEVRLRIRRVTQHTIRVSIRAGTYFVARNAASQNMVATEEKTIELLDAQWLEVTISAACANRSKGIPGSDDRFTIHESPAQQELKALMPVLNEAGVPYATRQAAVWIVTDNADYDDLGILTSGFGGFGPRVIREDDVVTALRICENAGINVTRKAIWADRQTLLKGLQDVQLRAWLMRRR